MTTLVALASWTALCAVFACPSANATTWVVETDSALASDRNPGTEARPLKTLAEAMRRLEAGDEVLVGDGIYREAVVVPKLNPPEKLTTTIRALHAGKAVVRGSDIAGGWAALGEGRFATDWRKRPEPAQVYFSGTPLKQIGGTVFGGYPDVQGHELAAAHRSDGGIWPGRAAGDASTLKPGEFAFDANLQRLVIRLADGAAPGAQIEVSTRPYVFLAENINGLHLTGLVFEHANTSSLARQGAVKIFGNDNRISGVTIRLMDSIGLQLFGTRSELLDSSIEDCGQLGLNARGKNITIARNRIVRNNSRGFNKWWEAGGIKIVGDPGFHDSIISDNVVAFNRGDGIWIDWMNTRVQISHNVAAYNAGFGIHYEASQFGRIEGNASYGNTQRGIYALESSDTLIEGNVVLANGLEGIVVADGERSVQYPQLKPRNNRVFANLIGWNKEIELMLPPAWSATQSDRNTFLAEQAPGAVQGWTAFTNRPARGLAAWRERSQLDAASRERVARLPAAIGDILRERRLPDAQALRALVLPLLAERP